MIMSIISLLLGLAAATPILDRRDGSNPGFNYDTDKVRGVNLGGWFVLEPFITPSLFQAFPEGSQPVDEFHYTQQLGKDEAASRLNQHWSSWITESDFNTMAGWGINHVRIPVGYWAFVLRDGDPFVQGQEHYLDQAIGWARDRNIKVWIDVHGAPGSQNGFDNSGFRLGVGEVPHWLDANTDYVSVTHQVIQYLASKYGQSSYNDVVTAIELINEPLGPELNMDTIKQFYVDGFNEIRDKGSDTGVAIHDAFQPLGYYNDFYQLPQFWNVLLDHHQYQVFSAGELERDLGTHIQTACNIGHSLDGENLWRITGEWSAALTDCAPWLNGLGRAARYEGQYDNSPYIGSCSEVNSGIANWSGQLKSNTRQYIEAQLDAYERGTGWIFWTFHTESASEWDMNALVQAGVFPVPFTDRQFPNQCGF